MNLFSLVVTIVVLLAVALAILLFERRRAEEIDGDLGGRSKTRRRHGGSRPDE